MQRKKRASQTEKARAVHKMRVGMRRAQAGATEGARNSATQGTNQGTARSLASGSSARDEPPSTAGAQRTPRLPPTDGARVCNSKETKQPLGRTKKQLLCPTSHAFYHLLLV